MKIAGNAANALPALESLRFSLGSLKLTEPAREQVEATKGGRHEVHVHHAGRHSCNGVVRPTFGFFLLGLKSKIGNLLGGDPADTARSRYKGLMQLGVLVVAALAYMWPGTLYADWSQFPLPVTSAAGAITAVSRIPNSMEVFWVGVDGSVHDANWYDGGSWKQFPLALPGGASPCGGIAAVSRIPNSMEVFWVGADGSVQDKYWYDGGSWTQFELAPKGSAATCSGIAAVSRIPNSMEVWWVGADGSVQDKYWYAGGSWTQFELAPKGSASTRGGIAAVSRVPNSMEVWWVGADGSVQDKYWYDGFVAWKQFPLASSGWASLEGGIAAVSPTPDNMVVWYIGANGSVQQEDFNGGWGQYELAGPGSASSSSRIAATSRARNTMEVWWVGADRSVQDAYWYDAANFPVFEKNWQRFPLAGQGSASDTGGIHAVSRIPNSMELWWAGAGGVVRDANWYGPFSTARPSLCVFAANAPCIYAVSFDSSDGRNAGVHWEGDGVSDCLLGQAFCHSDFVLTIALRMVRS